MIWNRHQRAIAQLRRIKDRDPGNIRTIKADGRMYDKGAVLSNIPAMSQK